MTEAGWTREKPTEAGWYWFRDLSRPYEDEREPYVVKVRQRGGRLCVGNCDIDGPPYSGEWLGPLSPDSYQQGLVAGLREAANEMCYLIAQYGAGAHAINLFGEWLKEQTRPQPAQD